VVPRAEVDLSAVDYTILVVHSPERLVAGAPGDTGRRNGEH
jgi:hypothetical protein